MWSRFWTWILVKSSKLKVKTLRLMFGWAFEAQLSLVKNMKLNFDIFVISLKSNTLVRELTLGSMVPLAMFVFCVMSEKYLAKTTTMKYGRRWRCLRGVALISPTSTLGAGLTSSSLSWSATEGLFLLNYIKFILQVIQNILNTTKIIHVDVLKYEIILDGKIQLGVVWARSLRIPCLSVRTEKM